MIVSGIFVGGASRRMHGRPKGLLLAPNEPERGPTSVIARTIALARELGQVVLVGRAEAYASLGVDAIADAAAGEGPLGGLVALLEHARGAQAIALACDMPFVDRAVLLRLASFAPEASAVAARDGGGWSPMFARYDSSRAAGVARARLAAGERSMRALLDALDARALPLTDEERATLRDWDTPEDVARAEEEG